MRFEEYIIVHLKEEIPGVFLLRVVPKNKKILPFKPGQFYHLKNPTYHRPIETRPFSITTSSMNTTYLEFFLKPYGEWTRTLLQKKVGEHILLFGPMGSFTLAPSVTNAVFIAGGVGITPIFSIIQSMHDENKEIPITLLYANKTHETILKKKEIEKLFHQKTERKLIHVFSQVSEKTEKAYAGRITKELLEKEIDLKKQQTFFISGSKGFITEIEEMVMRCGVEQKNIKKEIFSV